MGSAGRSDSGCHLNYKMMNMCRHPFHTIKRKVHTQFVMLTCVRAELSDDDADIDMLFGAQVFFAACGLTGHEVNVDLQYVGKCSKITS